ncbi:hypothetical protein [uncultured Methanobrevibacter sp.]|uniref:hypothetical protein n=1 Tax=uncultured Methanobrevibacter sp. TaxID=253161 RepID=UPI0025F2F901|nr:hypothetical protein [uncultured Methanobrevibacter sp.]
MKKEDVLIFIGVILFCVGFSGLLAHSAKQRKAETQIIIMVDQNGHIIKELTIDELRKETSGEMKHDNN